MTIRLMLLLLLIGADAFAAGQSTVLGVLEDVPGVYFGEGNSRKMRVVFRKDSRDWHAFRSQCPDQDCLRTVTSEYPREVTWTITFDGNNLGKVTARTPREFNFYSHVGLQEITGKNTVPTVGARSTRYGGFADAEVFRPLIANSQPYFKDPESWKPSHPSIDIAGLLRKAFRQRFPKLCRVGPQDETTLKPFLYRDNDVVLLNAYMSKNGWVVARLHLEEAIDCDDQEAGFQIDDPWFVVDPQNSVKYLDDGMWLVDAGDYDNDGKSELVFSIDRYNRGGYEIFYDDFNKHATFEFSYH